MRDRTSAKIAYFRGLQNLDMELEKTPTGFRVKAKADPGPAYDVVNRVLDRLPVVPVRP